MPVLPCPLGSRCSEGDDGTTWKTVEIEYEKAKELVADHVKYAHPISSDHLNVNNGTQGGNFFNSALKNPIFNIHTTGRRQFPKNYQKLRFIGRGNFGETWLVQHVSHTQHIMKEISCTEQDANVGKKEVELLKKCTHESIVCYIDDFYEESKLLIIMEYCDGGDLAKFIDSQKQPLSEDFIREWFRQLTSGVCYIHSKKIIHRDLKTANIFLTLDKRLKIGDFGISKRLTETTSLASTLAGTAVYMAPEIHGGEKYDRMADMWSLGIVMFEIITFKKPFHGYDFLQAISKE